MSDRWYDRERGGRSFDDDQWRNRDYDQNSSYNDRTSRYDNRRYGQDDAMDRDRGYGRDRGRIDVPNPSWAQDNDRRMSNDMNYGREGQYGGQDYNRQNDTYGNRGYSYGREGQSSGQDYGRQNYGRQGDMYDDRWRSESYGRQSDMYNNRSGSNPYDRQGMMDRGRGFGQDFDSSAYDRGYGNQGYSGQNQGYGQQGNRPGWSYTEVWFVPGPFTGRGPKGYTRSDERIKEDVCERLSQHGRIDASNIDVKVENGEVTLGGTVNDRQTKRMAEDALDNLSGVREVHNHLRVQQDDSSQSNSMMSGQDRNQTSSTMSTQSDQNKQRNSSETTNR